MKNNKIISMLLAAGGLAGAAHAEFGASAGASFNYKAKFHSAMAIQPRAFNPGAPTADTDHYYDDGYNRTDSASTTPGVFDTTFWGYQDASQYDPLGDSGNGTIKMNSSQTTINEVSSSDTQEDAQPAMEVYWQTDLTQNERWNVGVRVALRWQSIEFDNHATYGTTIDTISDTYSLNGISPPGPFSGVLDGWGYAWLSDIPVRSTSTAAGPSVVATRKLDANLFGCDAGPTLAVNVTKKLRAVLSAGGTVAWMQSEFSYSDGALASGSSTDGKCLLGAYLGADVQYQIGKRWGVFAGAAFTKLQDFDQQVDGRSAELQFGESYTLRTGVFFR